jgi:butyrate kinase
LGADTHTPTSGRGQGATTPEGAAELVQIAAAAQGGDAQAVEVAQSIAAEVIAPMLETVAALEGERQAVLDSGQIVVPEVLDQKISDMRRAILLFVLLEYGWH